VSVRTGRKTRAKAVRAVQTRGSGLERLGTIVGRPRQRTAGERYDGRGNPSVLLVDPDGEYRTTLRARLVEAGIDVVGETGSGVEAEILVSCARPDIIVMEVVLDDRDGIHVARLIRARDPEVQVILLTGIESPNAPLNLKLAGLYVAAFLWKSDGASWVVEAVGRASR
jgi:DNA-binding NarL/FixJ family response regulator